LNDSDKTATGPRETEVRPRIVDLVFEAPPRGHKRRLLVGLCTVAALYATVVGLIGGLGQSAGPWSAEMAARVHDAISIERTVEMTPPTPPAPPPETPSAAPVVQSSHASRPAAQARATPGRTHPGPAAPAQAGALAAVSSEPVDLTGTAFVVGAGTAFAGGATTATGTNPKPVIGAVAPGGTGDGSGGAPRTLARPVSLDQSAWACPWPAEADAAQVDEQTVVIRVIVRADGHAERVELVADPGLGFGSAARNCALGTRFQPARNGAGAPITGTSPPIRVHFFR
jgi:protein TonB